MKTCFPSRARGMTLIEVMTASAILSVALLGLTGSHVAASNRMARAQKEAEAAALAQELAGVLATLPYTSSNNLPTGVFANTYTSNDADVTDNGGGMDSSSVKDPVAAKVVDHAEAELPTSIQAILTPLNATDPNNPTKVFERYWTISPINDPISTGAVGGVTISAVVRYRMGNSYRHVSVVTTRFDYTQLRR